MAVGNVTLFCNTTTRQLIASTSNAAVVQPPVLVAGEIISLRVALIEQTGIGPALRLSVLDPSAMACKVSIGVRGGTPVAAQTSFTPAGQFLSANLDLTTAAFSAIISAGTPIYLEVQYGQSGNFTIGYQGLVTAYLPVSPAGATTVAGPDEYLTKTISLATFVSKIGAAGETFITASPDGTKGTIWGTNNDGSARIDPIDL